MNHLWQSTVFAAAAWLLTLALRKNRARVRHWIWLTASCKFLVPLSLLIALGSHIEWRKTPETIPPKVLVVMDEISQPFTAPVVSQIAAPAARDPLPAVLFSIWACGFLGISCSWLVRWRRIRNAVREGSPVQLGIPVKAISSPTLLEPGVFGVFRPVLLLPEGIFERLTPGQFRAVVEHELCHIRHRDNLVASIHMFIETVFWFHPLVWWIGKRMVEEREKACDEEVLNRGGEARVYAEAILNVCKLYVESPLACVPGVTGSDLKKRIEGIMNSRIVLRLSFAKKLVLAGAGMAALTIPIVIGTMNAPAIRAQSPPAVGPTVLKTPAPPQLVVAKQHPTPPAKPQSQGPPSPVFDVGSIRPAPDLVRFVRSTGGPGTDDPELFTYENGSLEALVSMAYQMPNYRIVGPYWLENENFVVTAKVPPGATKDQLYLMMQNMLAERFKMTVHREKKEMQAYDLVIAKGGPKLKESAEEVPKPDAPKADPKPADPSGPKLGKDGYPVLREGWTQSMMNGRARILQPRRTMEWLADYLGHQLHSPVNDATGLMGKYDFALFYAYGDENERRGPDGEPGLTLQEAIQAQLGLKLESKKEMVDILVVDYAERRPTGN